MDQSYLMPLLGGKALGSSNKLLNCSSNCKLEEGATSQLAVVRLCNARKLAFSYLDSKSWIIQT